MGVMARRGFGEVERRKNARTGKTTGYRARYWGPDLERYSRTFTTKQDAEAWLASEESLIARGTWTAPPLREAARAARAITVAEYATAYIHKREAAGRAPKTIQEYRRYVARFIDADPIGKVIVPEVTREHGEAWHLRLLEATGTTMAGRVYSLLSSVFNEAQRAGLVTVHPLQVKGAGNPPRQSAVTSATPFEVAKIAAGMPERVRVAIYVMAYCGLRISEMRGLRRGDVDTERGVIHVRQQVQQIVGKVARRTKTTASNSTAPLPSEVAELIGEHMSKYTRESRDALVFTSGTGSAVNLSKFYSQFKKAREGAGRPDLRVHDLRHTFAMLNVTEGKADVRTVQRLLRQSSPAAALRYQHAAASAVEDSASRLNSLIVPIPEAVEEMPRHLRAV
jgi:integrase